MAELIMVGIGADRDRHIMQLKLPMILFLHSHGIFQCSFLFNLLFSHINILVLMVININNNYGN